MVYELVWELRFHLCSLFLREVQRNHYQSAGKKNRKFIFFRKVIQSQSQRRDKTFSVTVNQIQALCNNAAKEMTNALCIDTTLI